MGRNNISSILLLATLLAAIVLKPPSISAESDPPTASRDSAGVESIMAGLSDEQVRQMLLAELRTNSMEEQYTQQQKMVGPAGLFNRLLNRLSGEHDSNEAQIRKLWDGIPRILPDLHTVFLTL